MQPCQDPESRGHLLEVEVVHQLQHNQEKNEAYRAIQRCLLGDGLIHALLQR